MMKERRKKQVKIRLVWLWIEFHQTEIKDTTKGIISNHQRSKKISSAFQMFQNEQRKIRIEKKRFGSSSMHRSSGLHHHSQQIQLNHEMWCNQAEFVCYSIISFRIGCLPNPEKKRRLCSNKLKQRTKVHSVRLLISSSMLRKRNERCVIDQCWNAD